MSKKDKEMGRQGDRETRRGEEGKAEGRRQKAEEDNPESRILNPESYSEHPTRALKSYVDGQLGWWAERAVRRHVTVCAQCREEMQAMRNFSALLQNADAEPLSPQLRARILAAVPDTTPVLPARQILRRKPSRPLLAWGAVASALLVCFALYPAYQAHFPTPSAALQMSKSSTAGVNMPRSAGGYAGSAPAKSTAESAAGTSLRDTKDAGNKTYIAGMPSSAPPPAVAGKISSRMMSPGTMPGAMSSGPAAVLPPTMMSKSAAAAEEKAAADVAALPYAQDKKAQNDIMDGHAAKGAQRSDSHSAANASAAISPSLTLPLPGSPHQEAALPAAPKPSAAESFAAKPVARSADTHNAKRANTVGGMSMETQKAKTTNALNTPKTADILLLVTDVAQSRAAIEQTTRATGGHVTLDTSTAVEDTMQSRIITLQIPTSRFDTFLAQLRRMGEVESQNITDYDGKKADSAGHLRHQPQAGPGEASGRAKGTSGLPLTAKQHAVNNATLPPSDVKTSHARARPANQPKPRALSNVTIRLRAKR